MIPIIKHGTHVALTYLNLISKEPGWHCLQWVKYSKVTPLVKQTLTLCTIKKGAIRRRESFLWYFYQRCITWSRQDTTSDKSRSRDNVWNNWPAIFKRGHEGQEKSEKVFQTKEDQRGMKTKSNEWSWAGYFFKDVLVTIIKLDGICELN